MLVKTGTILLWALVSYVLLLFWAASLWTAIPLGISLAGALAGIGFAVMHDGGHGSYSGHRLVNRLAAGSLDAMGGSSYVWNQKHNVLHHTYPNVVGLDDDIDFYPFFRLAEGQPRHWFHRFQFIYWVPLFVFFTSKWIFVDDFLALARGAVGGQPMVRPRGMDLLQLLLGKVCFLVWGVIIPLLAVGLGPYLLGYVLVSTLWGLTLGLVFQLAHAVDGVTFITPSTSELPAPWFEHQLATTTDFARHNRLLTWYVGGLNYQVEHHLFPKVGHRHYPALARIVREVCGRHGIVPHDHPSTWSAFRAHLRHLRRMGKPDADPGGEKWPVPTERSPAPSW